MPDIVWKIPVEKDDVSLTGDGESVGQRYGIGKAADDKPMIRQLISNGLATIRVVLDVEDPDEVLPQFSYLLVCSSRFGVSQFILIHYCVSTFLIERFHHALVARFGASARRTLKSGTLATPRSTSAPRAPSRLQGRRTCQQQVAGSTR